MLWSCGLVALLGYMVFGHHGLRDSRVHAWNVYHYWLGAKYQQELGYFDMYDQTLAAWKDAGSRRGDVARYRDLRTYDIVPVPEGPPVARGPRWTDARWAEFQSDLALMEPLQTRVKWAQVVRDRGYNASPAWGVPARWVTEALDLGNVNHLRVAKSIDMVLVLVALAALTIAFGPGRSMVAIWVALLVWNNPTRFLGSFIQYDWLALVLCAAAAVKARRHGTAGALLGAAAVLRVFPAVFLAGMLARAGLDLLRTRSLPAWAPRLVGGFALAVVLGLGLGSAGPRGVGAWGEWSEKIAVHNHHHKFGEARVGLAHIFSGPTLGVEKTVPRVSEREAHMRRWRPVRYPLALLMLGLLAAACWRRDDLDCFVLAVVAFFVLTVSSRYYWSALALLPLLGARKGDRFSLATGLGVTVFLTASYYVFCQGLSHRAWIRWRLQNEIMMVTFVGMTAALAWRALGDAGREGARDDGPESAAP